MKHIFLICTAFLFTLTFSVNAQQTKRIYLLGNSLTDGVEYDGFKSMALLQGNSHTWARHSIPGAPLDYLWEHRSGSEGFTTDPFRAPENAFANYQWDVVTLQPAGRPVEATAQYIGDKQTMLNYAAMLKDKSPDVQIYIYSRYPRIPPAKYNESTKTTTATADDWAALWDDTNTASIDYDTTREYFEKLYEAYNKTDFAGLNKGVHMIPVGDVMYALNKKAKEGKLPGHNSLWFTYDDRSHQKGVGKYIIMGTFYSTIYKEDIRGTVVPANYGVIAPELLEVIQETIYEIVFTHPYSGATLADLVPVSGIEMDKSTLSMNVLNRNKLTATILPANAAKKGVIWSSSNTGVAMVNDKGVITSLSAGTTIITATSFDGGFSDQCEVTVSGTINGTTQSGALASWNFNDKAAQQVDYTNISAVDSLTGISNTNAYVGAGLNVDKNLAQGLTGTSLTATTLTGSLADGDYIGFTVKGESGKLLSISKIQLAPIAHSEKELTFTLFSSVKGFAEGNEIGSCKKQSTNNTSLVEFLITGHDNINEIEFRVYMHGQGDDFIWHSVGIGRISENGFIITGSILSLENNPPTKPTEVWALEIRDTHIGFEWDEATDDYFVKGYNFYLGSEKQNSELIEGTTFTLEGLTSGQLCNVAVEAVDFFDMPSSEKASLSVTSNRPPVAVITPSVTSGKIPLEVTFTSNLSTDLDEEDHVLGYDWYINGKPLAEKGNTLVYSFTQQGEYEVSLVVMDTRNMLSLEAAKTTITVTADKYAINVTGGATSPTVTEAFSDDEVTIVANEAAEGMAFDKWMSDDVEFDDETSATTTFAMPAKAVSITASFKQIISVEQGNADKVRIFPNPAKEYITITGGTEAAYTIATVTGVTVQSGILNGEPVYIGALPTGFYLMKAGTQTLTFIKE